jgi:peroxiredoxin
MQTLKPLAIGSPAPPFSLPGVDGKTYTLETFADKKNLVVIFTCNHCPYAQAYEDRIIAIQRDYAPKSVALVGINPNYDVDYPEDSFENMKKRAQKRGFNFPYLRDETQEVAKDYGAQRTPHVYVFDEKRILRYRGRVDDNWEHPNQVKIRYLRDALDLLHVGYTVKTPEAEAIGCSIKWKPSTV